MIIGLEARWITFEKTGFGRYAFNLLKELSKIDHENRYLIYLNREYQNEQIFLKENFKKIFIKNIPEIYKHVCIPFDIISRNRNISLFHFLYNAPSLYMPCPYILTIHDVSYKYIPEMISFKNRFSIFLQLKLNAKRSKKIIAVSESSKKDIIKFFNVNEDKIDVIYEGVDESFRNKVDENKRKTIINKYELPKKFILYVGTYLPHKNLETLLCAFHSLKTNTDIKHKLVLAGKKGKNYSVIAKLISDFNLEKDVLRLGFIPDDDLPVIYNLSELFVFPSLYEGFGLPILEAMSCGVPVLASASSCLPEIGGDAAEYFRPKDIEALGKKIFKIIKNSNLKVELREKGFQRAKLFSWSRMAEKTLELYERVSNELC